MSLFICHYGCGRPAIKQNKSGNWMCDTSSNKCPENKLKNSQKNKLKYLSGERLSPKVQYRNLPEETKKRMAWATGLSKETDESVAKVAAKLKGRRIISDKEKLFYIEYREKCAFKLSAKDILKVKGYELLKEFGMYHKTRNLGGVVRDHRISIWYGWLNKIDPKILSHPVNCEFISHKNNAIKSIGCSLDLETLLEEIEKWDCEGNRYTLLVENQ